MKTKFLITVLVCLAIISVVSASMLIPANDKARDKGVANNAPVIEKTSDGDLVLTPPGLERVVFIHYKKGYGRVCDYDGDCEPEIGENPSCADCKKNANGEEPDTSSCYGFLARGTKWKELPVDYVIDPDNTNNLTESFIINAISSGAEEWDAHTTAELFGTYSIDYDSSWDSDTPDGKNELLFGDYPQDGVIAVAIVWGYFGGRPSNREIIEFDILFDTDFTWGDATNPPIEEVCTGWELKCVEWNPSNLTGEPWCLEWEEVCVNWETITLDVMDLQNIATHEIGHGAGLADLYETACIDETMYGYSAEGETKKRDLNAGDITGIKKLYG